MKFTLFQLALLSASALPAFAQMVSIAAPAPGSTLAPGSSVVVELDSADGLTGFQQISVALGAQSVSSSTSGSNLGDMLYAGNYTPVRHEMNKPAYQNFTVTIPSTLSGNAVLNVAHFYLIGAGLEPVLEMKNTTFVVAE
ncbi:hypothetical protein M0805_005464 [Coniferiporia weirii]|nr:hypothetical protein M0805_005464 [Coniferiporia weirii]